MKQLITLSILLLAGLSLASAQSLDMTSGSMVVQLSNLSPTFTAAGADFLFSGEISLQPPNPLAPVGTGAGTLVIEGDTNAPDLFNVSLSVHGVPYGLPNDLSGSANAIFQAGFSFSGPGTFFGPFTFSGTFAGLPVSELSQGGCMQLPCSLFEFQGGGTVRYEVVPFPNQPPGVVEISQATFTFQAPEPPTMDMLLLGVAGPAVLGGRRRARAALPPAG